MDHVLMPMFAVPIYTSNIEVTDEIVTLAQTQEYKRLDIDNGHVSVDQHILDNKDFEKINQEIKKHVSFFTKDLLHTESYINFEIQNSWLMKHKKGDWSHPHIHVNSILSGIFYIQTDEESGDLIFERDHNYVNLFPPAIQVPVSERNVFNSKEWTLRPNKGNIYIFPSNLAHKVTISKSENLRYCLAFNIFPKGTLGLDNEEQLSVLSLK